MSDDTFLPGSEETEIERRGDGWAKREGERGKLGALTLTNDRVLFMQRKFASSGTAGMLGGLVAGLLQLRSERKTGPQPAFALADVRAARPLARRFGEQWEFTLADGSTCAIGGKGLREAWEPLVRRLIPERHGLPGSDDGEGDSSFRD